MKSRIKNCLNISIWFWMNNIKRKKCYRGFLYGEKYFQIKPLVNKWFAFIYEEPRINVHILNIDNQVFDKISSDPSQCYYIKVSLEFGFIRF